MSLRNFTEVCEGLSACFLLDQSVKLLNQLLVKSRLKNFKKSTYNHVLDELLWAKLNENVFEYFIVSQK